MTRVGWILCFVALLSSAVAFSNYSKATQNFTYTSKLRSDYPTKGRHWKSVEKNLSKKEAPVNEKYPHAVLFGDVCGGTIINKNWILTSAHCILYTGGLYVLAGTNNTNISSGQNFEVKRLLIHPRFTIGPHWLSAGRYDIKQIASHYDLMLAELMKPLALNDRKMAAVKHSENTSILPKTRATYAGFGIIGDKSDRDVFPMRSVTVEIVPEDICRRVKQYDSASMFCVQTISKDVNTTCNGDMGSGLMDQNGMLIGVYSWSENDAIKCVNGSLIFFAKVASGWQWIKNVTGVQN